MPNWLPVDTIIHTAKNMQEQFSSAFLSYVSMYVGSGRGKNWSGSD